MAAVYGGGACEEAFSNARISGSGNSASCCKELTSSAGSASSPCASSASKNISSSLVPRRKRQRKRATSRYAATLQSSGEDALFDRGDRLGWVQAFGAGVSAVHDRMAAVQAEGILKLI